MTHALIPVKELPFAKERLSPLLNSDQRRALALAMYRDVLDAALACDALDGVAVVSRDEDALAVAREHGASAMPEPGSLNEALTTATETLAGAGESRILVLAADLPLADSESIAPVATSTAGLALVRSSAGGTNALALAPGAIDFAYGPGSAGKHVAAGRAARLRVLELALPSLAFDIDEPDDLMKLAGMEAVGAHTRAVLRDISTPAERTAKR